MGPRELEHPAPEGEGIPADPDEVLQDLFEEVEKGVAPKRSTIETRFPADEALVDALYEKALAYQSLIASLATSRSVPSLLPPGRSLGDFLIEAPLGAGGSAVVYRASQHSLGDRPVALKVLSSHGITERERARFRAEALAASHLHHPNLAEVYGFGESEGLFFYAMELLEGPTLQEVLRQLSNRPAAQHDPEVRRRIVQRTAEVASALAAVHEDGLLHRDVKPGNILLRGPAEPDIPVPSQPAVLVDFGLVRPADPRDAAATRTTTATQAYASPEQRTGGELDARTDVFSLGATLHDLLAGRHPEDRDPASAGLEPLDQLVPGVDRDLIAVVAKASDREAEWRYPDAGALLSDLEAWLAGRSVAARRPRPLERATRWVRSHPRAVLRASFGAMGILIAIFVLGFSLDRAAGIREQVKAAEVAHEHGDLAALLPHLPALRSPVAGLWMGDELSETARRLSAGDPGDPLTVVRQRLEAGGFGGGLRAAVSFAKRGGLAAEPFLHRHLLLQLGKWPGAARAPSAEMRSLAIRLAAELFLERPDHGRAEARDLLGLRHRLLKIALAEPLTDDGLHAMSALSGCGTVEDAIHLLRSLADGRPEDPDQRESQRMALAAAARILRRSLHSKLWTELADIDTRALLEVVVPRGTGELPDAASWIGLTDARAEVVEASLFVDRGRGASLEPYQRVVPRFAFPKAVRLQAAMGDPTIRETLLSGGNIEDPHQWGWCCEAFGSQEVTRLALESLAGPARARFERGLAEAADEMEGGRPALEEQAARRAGDPDEEWRRIERGPGAGQDSGVASAQWTFRSSHVELRGTARAVRFAGDASHVPNAWDEGSSHLRMGVAPGSCAEMEFQIPEGWNGKRLRLVLEHLASATTYVPWRGQVSLRIDMDGRSLDGDYSVTWKGSRESSFPMDGCFLDPGPHVIALRIASATTDYWLHEVRVERLD